MEITDILFLALENSLDYRDPMPEDSDFKYPACRLPGAQWVTIQKCYEKMVPINSLFSVTELLLRRWSRKILKNQAMDLGDRKLECHAQPKEEVSIRLVIEC